MTAWDDDQLGRIGTAEELDLASRPADDRHGSRIVGSVVGESAAGVTLRLDPTA